TEEMSLARRAALLPEPAALVLALHALGDDQEAQAAAEVDGGADDGRVGRGRVHRTDEGAVDLQLVYRHPREGGERRIAGAEVVEGEADAEVAQLAQDLVDDVELAERERFGQL